MNGEAHGRLGASQSLARAVRLRPRVREATGWSSSLISLLVEGPAPEVALSGSYMCTHMYMHMYMYMCMHMYAHKPWWVSTR